MIARTIERRVEALEEALARAGPPRSAFVMARSEAEADRQIERLQTESPAGLPKTLFIMILAKREPVAEGA
jgi:hypothetical protein